MEALLLDSPELNHLIESRRRTGTDRWDEMWEGVLHMAPPPETEHQRQLTDLAAVFSEGVNKAGLGSALAGVKVAKSADQEDDFRVPDLSVVLKKSRAKVKRQGIAGGPDFVVEIYSPGDETYKKLDYYAALGVRELLIIHRDTKHIELYRLSAGKLRKAQPSPDTVTSHVLPLAFKRTGRRGAYRLSIRHTETAQTWTI